MGHPNVKTKNKVGIITTNYDKEPMDIVMFWNHESWWLFPKITLYVIFLKHMGLHFCQRNTEIT